MSSVALTEFQAIHERLQQQAGDPAWLKQLRRAGIERFRELGFPSTRLEEWKYTNLAPLTRIGFKSPNGIGLAAAQARVEALRLPGCSVLTFVDGRYAAELSQVQQLAEGVQLMPISAALSAGEDALLREYLTAGAAGRLRGAFEALSTALFEDGALVRIPAGTSVERPIQLLFVDSGAQNHTTAQLQNVVLVEQGASATVVESYVSLAEQERLTNVVSQLVCQADAKLDHYRVLDESSRAFHLSALDLELRERSRCSSRSVCLGGALVRNEIQVRLQGEGALVVLDGLFMVDQERHVDTLTVIDHAQPRCRSEQLYKGILDHQSQGTFSGKIRVHKDAQQTDALQSSKNLLLSEDATINARPQLEILADDVKCTHGATIGHLDEEALFYLRSRGLDGDLARSLLIQAFAAEIVERVPLLALRESLLRGVSARLPAADAGGSPS